MTEKREPYEPFACYDPLPAPTAAEIANEYARMSRMEPGMTQLRALEMARHLEDCTIKRQAILIRALMYLVGIQTVGLFLLAVFA